MVFGNFFKKKKPAGPSGMDLTIKDLKEGDIVDYFMKSWKVKSVNEYDWGNNFFSKEYQLDSGDEIIYVELEEDDELELSISRPAKVNSIDPNIREQIIENDEPQKKIIYKGKRYILSDDSFGHFRSTKDDNWSEMVSWTFEDEEEEEFICIERWGETDIEASIGHYVEEYEFTNIIPSSKS